MYNIKYRNMLKEIQMMKCYNEIDFIAASLANYYLELEDSVIVLFESKNFSGLPYVIRGQYEVILQILYLLEHVEVDVEECEKRARCYAFFHLLQKQELWHESGNEEHEQHFKQIIESSYMDIKKEFRSTKRYRDFPYWFTLFKGPASFNQLEKYLKFNHMENVNYGLLSQICHGKTTIGSNTIPDYRWEDISRSMSNSFGERLLPFAFSKSLNF